jgi:hypothetical protein
MSALGVVRFERDHVACRVVHQRVDPKRSRRAADVERGAVAHVAVKQRPGMLGLPPQPRVPLGTHTAWQAGIAKQPRDGRLGDRVFRQTPVEDERAHDERNRRARVLPPNVEQQCALLGRELATATTIRAQPRLERDEAAGSIQVDPSLQRRRCDATCEACTRHAKSDLGERSERGAELAARELPMRESADNLGAKQSDRLGMIAWA